MIRPRPLALALIIVGLALAPFAEAQRGRLYRHGEPLDIVSPNPAPPPLTYTDNTNPRQITSTAYCTGGNNINNAGPAAGDNKVWIAWQDNSGGCNTGTHNIKAQMVWDYSTGGTDSAVTVASCDPSSDDRHEAPSITRDPSTGKLFIVYCAITAAGSSPFTSPFYRISTNPNSIAAFDSQARVTGGVYLTEIRLGYTSDGTLHMIGQGHNRFLNYYTLSSGGTWTATQALVGHPTDSPPQPQGAPECLPAGAVINDVIWIAFSRDFSGCSGTYSDIHIIKSTDFGTTWTDVSGGNSFTRSTKLTATLSGGVYDFPAVYKAHSGSIKDGWNLTALSNGRPVVVFRDSGGYKAKLYSGSGSGVGSFSSVTIDSGGTGNQGSAIVATSADKLLAYGSPSDEGTGNFVEYASTDGGSSWTPTTLWTKSTEVRNKYPNARCFTGLGGRERCLVTWVQDLSGGAATNMMFIDRPQ